MSYNPSPHDSFAVQVRSRRGETIDMSLPLTCTIGELQDYFINEYNYHPSTVLLYNNVPVNPQVYVSSYPYGSLLLSTPGTMQAMPQNKPQLNSYNSQPVRSVTSHQSSATMPSSTKPCSSYISEPQAQEENDFQERPVHPVHYADSTTTAAAVGAHQARQTSASSQAPALLARASSSSAWVCPNDLHGAKEAGKKLRKKSKQLHGAPQTPFHSDKVHASNTAPTELSSHRSKAYKGAFTPSRRDSSSRVDEQLSQSQERRGSNSTTRSSTTSRSSQPTSYTAQPTATTTGVGAYDKRTCEVNRYANSNANNNLTGMYNSGNGNADRNCEKFSRAGYKDNYGQESFNAGTPGMYAQGTALMVNPSVTTPHPTRSENSSSYDNVSQLGGGVNSGQFINSYIGRTNSNNRNHNNNSNVNGRNVGYSQTTTPTRSVSSNKSTPTVRASYRNSAGGRNRNDESSTCQANTTADPDTSASHAGDAATVSSSARTPRESPNDTARSTVATPRCKSNLTIRCHVTALDKVVTIVVDGEANMAGLLQALLTAEPQLGQADVKLVYKGKTLPDRPDNKLFNIGIRADCDIYVASGEFGNPEKSVLLEMEDELTKLENTLHQQQKTLTDTERKGYYEDLMRLLFCTDGLQSLEGEWRQRRKDAVKRITSIQDSLQVDSLK